MQDQPRYTLAWLFFGFSGRIRRSTYLWSAILFVAAYGYVVVQIVQTPETSWKFGAWGLVMMALIAITAWSLAALSVKRLHDIGYPGPLMVAIFIPVVSLLFFLALCLWPGEAGDNRFGASPLKQIG